MPLSSMLSWLPTVISSSLRFRNEMSKSLSSSRSARSSSLLSGSQGISTPVRIPASAHADIVERYLSASRSSKWNLISSRPASAKSRATSGLNGMLVYMWRWNPGPNSSFSREIPSRVRSFAISGSPPVMPAPVALIARASSMTSSNVSHLLSFANIQSTSRRVSERGQ